MIDEVNRLQINEITDYKSQNNRIKQEKKTNDHLV